jgi:ABC-type transport system involved in multi-copper enzyme maturation permease subunit
MASVITPFVSARNDLGRALIVTRREVRDMFRDWRIIVPIIILTLVFPPLMNFTAGSAVRTAERYGADIVAERTFPFLLMVVGFFPISISLVIALETFVGEKERRSLEPLLSTPLTNLQLYIGKTLAATLPPLMGSYLGIIVYLVSLYFNIGWVPPIGLLVLVLVLTTVQALVMVAGAVVVSSQTTSVRAANLLASFIVVPMALLIQVEALIMFWARYNVLWTIILGLVTANVLLVRMGVRIFNREELLGREIDELNLKRSAKLWWRHVRGEPTLTEAAIRPSLPRRAWNWYRHEVLSVLGRIRVPALVVLLALAGAALLGIERAGMWTIPAAAFEPDQWAARFGRAIQAFGLYEGRGVALIFWQNLRVLTIASVLAVFSFGVLAIVIVMLPIGIVGFLGANVYAAGVAPLFFWAAIVPHAVLELPAIVLATAGALRLGASVVAPPPGKTVGEGWLIALADLFKLWIGVVLPLLLAAAFLEIYVTPLIVFATLGGS